MRATLKKRSSYTALFSALILSVSFITIAHISPLYAVNGTFKQQILPIDCVYQIINDGNNTIIYLTPDECGQIPEVTEEPIDPNPPRVPGSGGPTIVTITDTGSGIFQVPFVPTASEGQDQEVIAGSQYLPYVPLATVSQDPSDVREEELANALAVATPVIAMSAIALILLLLLFLL